MQVIGFTPQVGDRVLIIGPGVHTGGELGTVIEHPVKNSIPGTDRPLSVKRDRMTYRIDPIDLNNDFTIQLFHRPMPPRPKVRSFIRSDGREINWDEKENIPIYGLRAYTPADARAFAHMYEQAAKQLEWNEKYGSSTQ